ncbi:MAG: glycosyltransferase family 4 protein [Bacteroidota bacterium]
MQPTGMKKQKLIIVGPIAFAGGRYLEVNQIANAVKGSFNLKIISTESFIYSDSALEKTLINRIISLDELLYKTYFDLKILSLVAYFKNKRVREPFAFVNNKLSKKYFYFEEKRLTTLLENLKDAQVVLLPVQLSSGFLTEIINFCYKFNIICIVRTTGTIKKIPADLFSQLEKVSLFIHHSHQNANRLHQHIDVPFAIIDQSAAMEISLLNLSLELQNPLRYGFLGRFSKEKGAYEVCRYFSKTDLPFIIGGDGPQKDLILEQIENQSNCKYLEGYIPDEKKADFFAQIDVLVIGSFEETGPFTGLEAMAAGKLIISTKVGAMEERLKGTGNEFWFDIHEISSLDSAIISLESMNKLKLELITKKLRNRYLESYSEEIIGRKYLELIQATVLRRNEKLKRNYSEEDVI